MKIFKNTISAFAVLSLIVGGFFINSNTAQAASPIAINEVTAPVTGANSVIYTYTQYSTSGDGYNNVPLEANITWSPSPVNGIFAPGIVYTANIKVNVQLSNNNTVLVGANTVTVSGATTVSNPAGTIKNILVWNGGPTWNIQSVDVVAVFPATAAPTLIPSVASVTVTPATASFVQGAATQQLTATVAVVGGAAQTVTWTSSDPIYAPVDANGLVTLSATTPVASYIITATSTVDTAKSATSTITVTTLVQKNAPITTIANVGGGIVGQTITVPITVKNFTGIGSVSLSMDYDYQQLHFVNATINSALAGGMFNGNHIPDNMNPNIHSFRFGWYDASLSGVTLPDDEWIAKLDFTFLSGPANLTWGRNNAEIMYSDINVNRLNDSPTSTYYINGSVTAAPVVTTDLTNYNAALAAVNQDDYTTDSWAIYQLVVSANGIIFTNTQAELDTATGNILAAQTNLIKNAAAAELVIAKYESAPISSLEEVAKAEGLKGEVDAAVLAVKDPAANASFDLRISKTAGLIAAARAEFEAQIAARNNRTSGGGSYIPSVITPIIKDIVVTAPLVETINPIVGKVLGAEKFNFTKSIKNGSRGDEVMELQKFLSKKGYYTGKADGKFGSKTKVALVKFQVANKLKGNGVVGSGTRAILNK